jgi:histidyl-tRNA synthetase
MTIKAVRGVHDILPSEAVKWQHVETVARRAFEAYGYEEIRLPIFERTEVFARGIGETTDIVQKEMYTFEDRSGESLTLRPEATASLLRAYIEHGLFVNPKPVRLYTIGPMFRHERPQAGRYRQFHQLDLEAIGDVHPALDVEVIAVLMELFGSLGLADRLTLAINSIGDAACRPAYREKLVAYLRRYAGELCEECRERTERNPLRVLDCKNPRCRPALEGAPSVHDSLCAECAQHFLDVQTYLKAMGISYQINPRLVRGLDYYVRTTFELTTAELGAQNAVAGGGRYDGLVELLGGPRDPAIGFAVGIERVVQLLPERYGGAWEHRRPFAVLIPIGDEALQRLLPMAQALRVAKPKPIPVELGYGERKLRNELDRANKLGVAWAVIVGDAELAGGQAVLRDMKSGEQQRVSLRDLVQKLIALSSEVGRD